MRTRTRVTTSVPLEEQVVAALAAYGPMDPMSLLHRVEGTAGAVVETVCAAVVARRLRVDQHGKFALPEVERCTTTC